MKSQKGAVPLLILIAVIGVIGALIVTSFAPFRDPILSSLFPKQSSQAAGDEWTQDGHDAQRTGVTSENPATPWTFAWAFNGPDANGGSSNHIQDAPKEARVVTGGAHVYSPLGSKGLYAVRKTDGSIAWNRTETSFNATPAYDPTTQSVIAGGADGNVYKINADTGTVLATYNAGSPINKSILLHGGFAFAVTDSGQLHKITISSMLGVWVYSANSAAHTPASYSPSRDALVFATADLNVHAINNSNGQTKWKVKPTPNTPGFPNEFNYGWPVIAEKHGIVLIRMQLDHNALLQHAPGFNYTHPDQNVNRAWLDANPQYQNLFALNLDDGSKKFTPVVGYGSTEDYINGAPYGRMGTQPIVKVNPDGTEVVYMIFRNGQSTPFDYRWDSHMGEMVLDDTTIPGLQPGDFRFVKMNSLNGYGGNSYTFITDEQTPISMAGNTLFNAHWGASTSMRITDRSPAKGLTYMNPIEAVKNPSVVRSQVACGNFNPATHFTTCHLGYFTNNGRFFEGPGFWGYWNVVDPPGWRTGIAPAAGDTYSGGILPRYTMVSDGLMIVEGNGGELIVFRHSGTVAQVSPSPVPPPTPTPTPSSPSGSGPTISNIVLNAPNVPVYEKEEIKFDLATNSQYPYMSYDQNPPPGVAPGIGVSVEGQFSANGKTWTQPGFYMTETIQNGSGSSMYFTETGKKYWVVRFSPQETGTYTVNIKATDATGTSTVSAGSFTATAATKKGFIKVAQTDTRYFEFSNGELYFPIGPATLNTNNSYSQYKDKGPNLERPWLGGRGIYSTNWARWKSSAEGLGNEGIMTRLNYQEKAPGHDLSYELFYPQGHMQWQTNWLDDAFGPRIVSGKKYKVKFVYKTTNLAGPRIANQPYGLTVKTSGYPWGFSSIDQFDNSLRSAAQIVPHISTNNNWTTVDTTFTASSNQLDLFMMLDNVTAGQAYVDELSIQECLNATCTNLGGEIVRNPRADQHMFIEQRPAAFIDWQVSQGEQNGVFFKYVVHDKNDWIQNHLLSNGNWAAQGDGYYQTENTKARWLLRQWYRYLIARWGYSTAIHSWELNNEGPPNEEEPGTAAHWRTAQSFAKFMHDNDAHPHLATTSFWCCWRPNLWGNNTSFPDIDYADLHMYMTTNLEWETIPDYTYDFAMWTSKISDYVWRNGYPSGQKGVGKPIMRAETGLNAGTDFNLLKNPNPGIWYHNLLWGQLNEGAMFDPGYWYSEHLDQINQIEIAKPFWDFVKGLDLNKGGYVTLGSSSTNNNLRVFGQKNLSKNKAHIWVQNATHTWKKVMDNTTSAQSGTVSVTLNPTTNYSIETWNTYAGTTTTQTMQSDSTGKLTLQITNLADDTAFKITGPGATPVPSSGQVKRGDIDGNNKVDIHDYSILLTNFGKSFPGVQGDIDNTGKVDIHDYNILLTNFGR